MTETEALEKLKSQKIEFKKINPTDKIYWVVSPIVFGAYEFSFDKKKIYNLFRDYHKLSKKEREIFNKENPELSALVIKN